MQHRNAPLTPNGRRRLVALVEEEGLTFEAAAAASNVAKSTAHQWVSRWRAAGPEQRRSLACLQDRSSRPHRSPGMLSDKDHERCCEVRRRTGWGPRLVGSEVGIPHATVHRALHRRGAGKRTRGSRGAGWEFVHTLEDDCSRLAYSEIHDDERAETVTAFTRRALDWFLDLGIVAERLLTDNAWAYTKNKDLAALLDRRQILHKRTRPYTPKTDGKVERLQQTMDREWARGLSYRSSADRRAALPHWLAYYNERRRHSALGNRPPMSRVRDVLGHDS